MTAPPVTRFGGAPPAFPAEVASTDWRFLPGIPVGGRALLVCRDADGGAATGLSANFDPVIVVPGLSEPEALPPGRGTACFDLIAFPDGLPAGPGRSTWLECLRTARRLLHPGGVLYLGFANHWSYRRFLRGVRPTGFHAALWEVSRLLRRAGFAARTVYGAIPDHRAPGYLTPLRGEALAFTLERYLRARRRGRVWVWLARPATVWAFAGVLPGYGIVAAVEA